VDKKVAYQDFKEKEGKEYNDSIVSSIESLKEKKEEIKEITNSCNNVKAEIEGLKSKLDKKQSNKNQEVILSVLDKFCNCVF